MPAVEEFEVGGGAVGFCEDHAKRYMESWASRKATVAELRLAQRKRWEYQGVTLTGRRVRRTREAKLQGMSGYRNDSLPETNTER